MSKKPLAYTAKQLAASLNMPNTTNFPLRPDHTTLEAKYRGRISTDLFHWQRENRKDAPLFHLHDGPPFANGDLHIGHALNKVLKDILLRYALMTGHRIEHFPGWDCHGLPIEQKAIKSSLNGPETPDTVLELREKCAKFAGEAISRQHADMKDWGLLQDPSRQYRTMDKSYEADQLRVFARFVERGLVYSALRPVYWSPSSKTALAEAELEYRDEHNVASLYVSYPVSSETSFGYDRPVYLVVWTTTPWTLPANKAVAVNSQLEYNLVEHEGKLFILSDNAQSLFPNGKILLKIRGEQLLSLTYVNTIGETCPIFDGSFVTAETGTGLVHLAPAYGMEDYQLCKSHGILPKDILTDDGHYADDAPLGLAGTSIKEQDKIIAALTPCHDLLVPKTISHRYPIDWRTKEPVIQRATRQLFVNTAKIESELIQSLDSVEFHPPSGKARLAKMLQSRQEWCVSRQRAWGVPIPVLKVNGKEEPILDVEVIKHTADIVQREGTDAWWSRPVQDFIPVGHHLKNHVEGLEKGMDTLDVWFDSGTSWSLHKDRPADVYLEGGDQFRGWFQSSFITSVAATGSPPFKRVISHGFVVDEHGAKMSKSVGNVIAPNEIIRKPASGQSTVYGNDLMRAWVASSDWTRDSSIGPDILKSVAEVQQKIRNTCRFLLGNLSDYPRGLQTDKEKMWAIDKAIIGRTDELVGQVRKAYDSYHHSRVIRLINQFCVEDLSAFYFDLVKDRLYSDKPDSIERRSIQSALECVLEGLMRIVAPLLPFLAEEVHDVRYNDGSSVFQKNFPVSIGRDTNEYYRLYEARKQFRQQFPKPEKLKVSASIIGDVIRSVELQELLGVAELCLDSRSSTPSDALDLAGLVKIHSVTPTDLHKCPRCWMYYSLDADTLCHRCDHVLHKQ